MGVRLLPHNQETYGNMVEMFKTDKRVAVVQPTGTGKSYLALKWIEDNPNDNILILSPSNVIFEQFEKIAKNNMVNLNNIVECTYQRLNITDLSDIENIKASKIILDEFHRTGAEKWSTKIDVLLESHKDSQILGLTATPNTYLDRSRNMATEVFNDNLARYMELGEAIVDGILPIPDYIPVWYDYDDKLTAYQKNIYSLKTAKERDEAEKLLKKMRSNLQKSYGAEIMFKEHMQNDHGKYIVFCKDNNQLQLMQNKMRYWLRHINKNIKYYTTLYYMYDKDKQVQKFINDNDDTAIRLLFSIDRLNEGLHVPGIDGVILTRPTTSPIIYLQQIGRAFETNGNKPLIFDLVNNYKNVKVVDPEGTLANVLEHKIQLIAISKGIGYDCPIFGIFEDAKSFNEIYSEFESKIYMYNRWYENFNILKDFINEFNRLPKNSESFKDIKIGSWLNEQKARYNKGKLDKERQELLESIGVIFKSDDDIKWDEKFKILKEFISIYKRMPSSTESFKDIKIGSWLECQKMKYTKGKLLQEKQELLESIGITLNITYLDIIWNKKFELFKDFINEFDRLPKNGEIYKEIKIGSWIGNQKARYKKGKLDKERQMLLESVGVVFNKSIKE